MSDKRNPFEAALECLRAQDIEFGTPENAPAIAVLEAAGKVDKDRAVHECMRSVDEYLGADGDEDWDAIKALLCALPDRVKE